MRRRAMAVGLLIAMGAALWFPLRGALTDPGSSDNARVVERDLTWLRYLPAPGGSADVDVASLSLVASPRVRRLDLALPDEGSVVSLCMAETRQLLDTHCPGFRSLGHITHQGRDFWLGQLGESDHDWRALMDTAPPAWPDVRNALS